ncbi:MAG: GNAT family N-acetyltransferase [Rhodospirillales bacterium CG15_BIG_FIL_POST_REV_8_21_14_020_66_15]|nr:MAG: GNAT family N-acetyltransferase [Rhodospirillales bacterium CG15_BIG_FIL_POST_REV_8_21_14_020_66_15]
MGGVTPALSAPEPLVPRHDLSRFANGVHASLDEWLRERARTSEGLSARTYVVCPRTDPDRVVGYFSLSTAQAERQILPTAKLRRGSPDEVPFLLIGRLAVDAAWRGKGVGTALLTEALGRALNVSDIAGLRGVIAHAIDEAAVDFYQRHGFVLSPLGERVMLMPIETVRALVGR